MSDAENLLNSLTDEQISTYLVDPSTEPHIVIDENRIVSVPEELRRIAVQYDHNVETVTFDCPRYWDGHDLSTMYIFVNYARRDGVIGMYLTDNLVIDEEDPTIIHFDWTIKQEITAVDGPLTFLVCAKRTNEEGNLENHWNTELNTQMSVSLGLEAEEIIMEEYADIITDLLTRMDQILIGDGRAIDPTLTLSGVAADAATVGEKITYLYENTVKEEVDPTVPEWAKQPEKPEYSYTELTDANMLAIKDGNIQTNLNSEMVGGKTLVQIKSYIELVNRYNVPQAVTDGEKNILNFSHLIDEYETGMRILFTIRNLGTSFTENIIPKFSSNGNVNGFEVINDGDNWKTSYRMFDGNDSTGWDNTWGNSKDDFVTLKFPMMIKPTKIHLHAYNERTDESYVRVYGVLPDDTEVTLIDVTIRDDGIINDDYVISNTNFFKAIKVTARQGSSTANVYVYEVRIDEGEIINYNPDLKTYVNVNNLGEKPIDGTITFDKNYELVYQDDKFTLKEM